MAPREETEFGPGETGASDPRVPGIIIYNSNGAASITINAPGSEGNDPVVTYSIRVMHDLGAGYVLAGYVQLDGTIGISEVFLTLASWGATITITELTVAIPYTFASRAQNELAVISAWCAESDPMNCNIEYDIDYGLESTAVAREKTDGNVKLDETTGVTITAGGTAIEATNAETWWYGPLTLTCKLLSWVSDDAIIAGEFSEDGGVTWAAATLSRIGGLTGLPTSPTGITYNDIIWDSYTDSGTSEYQRDMMLRLRAQDESGDWGPYETTAEFILYNLPSVASVVNSDGYSWGKDSTPTFQSIIPSIRGGTAGYPVIYIYDAIINILHPFYPKKSSESVIGWEYESGVNNWIAMPLTGIPAAAINGVNRMRYTMQSALAAGDYTISFKMGELRDVA